MSVREVAKKIEERLPLEWSEDWDNVGLIIGDPESSVKKIAVALDATDDAVAAAIANGCGMLLVHHPAIFIPMEKIVMPAPAARMIRSALSGGVAVYSSHTNWDSSPEGVNAILARHLGLVNVRPITPSKKGAWGIGAIGDLPSPATVHGVARRVKEAWRLSTLLTYGDDATPLSKAALCGGAGGDFLREAIDQGADVFITADVSYHHLLNAQLARTRVITANHGEMERVSLPHLCDLVREVSSLEVVLLENSNWTPRVI
jgi:dinuclear metal center YbgI/SA1388 family protein